MAIWPARLRLKKLVPSWGESITIRQIKRQPAQFLKGNLHPVQNWRMAYEEQATRGGSPSNLNLNYFSCDSFFIEAIGSVFREWVLCRYTIFLWSLGWLCSL